MNLEQFIQAHLDVDDPLGDLAKDITRDKDFPIGKTDEEITAYLNRKADKHPHIKTAVKLMLSTFARHKLVEKQ